MKTRVFFSPIRRRDMDSVLSCLVSDENGLGNYVQKFLSLAREILGFEYGVALRSPLFALGAALDCLALEPGSKVIVSALSPRYYRTIIESRGFQCLYADVDPDSAQITDTEVSRLIAQGGRVLVLFEPLGFMPEADKIMALGIPVIEDASQSLGAFSGTARAGMSGSISFIGMEYGSVLTACGGALLFSAQKREATVLKNLSEAFDPEILLPDMNAALAFTQLKELNKHYEKRKELYALYSRPLLQSRHKLLVQPGEGEPSWYAFPVILKSGVKDVRAYARKKEVESEEAFQSSLVASGAIPDGECPQARSLLMRCVAFPLHPAVGKTQTQKIAKVLATLP